MQDVEVLGKMPRSDHRKVRSLISLYMRRERKELIRKKPINALALRGKIEAFRISQLNRYSALAEETDLNIQAINDNLTCIITERAIAVGGKIVRRDTGKISQEAKDLIKKPQSIKVSNLTDRIGLAELSKLINRLKLADIRKHNIERTEHAL